MKFEPLAAHRQRFQVGKPIPYAIVDAGGRLLLARGQVLDNAELLENLLEREAKVDVREADDVSRRIAQARPEQLLAHWRDTMDTVGRLWRAGLPAPDVVATLDRALRHMTELIERDPDLAIFQVVRADDSPEPAPYAIRHATHTVTAAYLALARLGWDDTRVRCVLRAAMTMNISMTELQNRLVNQSTPLTAQQRAQIASHPERSAQMLEKAGVTDAAWLQAVRQHHAVEGGGGYPAGVAAVSEAAALVRRADAFTAKFSARLSRPALLADRAVRLAYQLDQGDAMAMALIKSFGLYPPGCTVRLKSGETGLVMRRSEAPTTPLVAVVADRAGDALLNPLRRDTAKPEHAIAAVLPAGALKVRVGVEKLVACIQA